jgi:DNA-binding Lrp family transcriptional regulator
MLHEFLKTIRDGEVQSLLEIARALRISPAIALQLADDLARRGYLQEIGADYDTPQVGCVDCPAGSNCQALTRHWFLTEKGRAAVSAIGQEMGEREGTYGGISSS